MSYNHPMTPTDSHAERVSALFTRIARRYDLMNRLMTFGQDQRWRRLAARNACLNPAMTSSSTWVRHGRPEPGHPESRALRPRDQRGLQPAHAGRCAGEGSQGAGRGGCAGIAISNCSFRLPGLGFPGEECRRPGSGAQGNEAGAQARRPAGRTGHNPAKKSILLPFIRFYLRVIIPLLGVLVTGDREAYRYLPASTEGFLSAEELAEKLRIAGFIEVGYQHLMAGTTALHWGEKD